MLKPKKLIFREVFTTDDGKIYEITDDRSFFEITPEQLDKYKNDDVLLIMMTFESIEKYQSLITQ